MTISGDSLRTLHRVHRQLAELRERRGRGPKQIKAHEANVASLKKEHEQATADSKAAQMLADQKQLQLRANEDKGQQLQAKLASCSTNREYQALREQIAADQMAASVLEDEILESLGKVDDMKAAIGAAAEDLSKSEAELEKIRQSVTQQRELIEGDLTRLQKELILAEEALPSDFRQQHDRIVRAKGDESMAEVDGNLCGGCYQQITTNMVNYLSMSKVVCCTACGRLLYLPEGGS